MLALKFLYDDDDMGKAVLVNDSTHSTSFSLRSEMMVHWTESEHYIGFYFLYKFSCNQKPSKEVQKSRESKESVALWLSTSPID
jgi:hypothetical protein